MPKCEICDEGLMKFPGCYVNVKGEDGTVIRQELRIGDPKYGKLYEFGIPCKCSRGQRYAERMGLKFSELDQNHAFNWIKNLAWEAENKNTTRNRLIDELIRKTFQEEEIPF